MSEEIVRELFEGFRAFGLKKPVISTRPGSARSTHIMHFQASEFPPLTKTEVKSIGNKVGSIGERLKLGSRSAASHQLTRDRQTKDVTGVEVRLTTNNNSLSAADMKKLAREVWNPKTEEELPSHSINEEA